MKKNKITGIIFLVVLLLVMIIPTILPKSYSEIIQINSNTITNFSTDLEGKIFKYGTKIDVEAYYDIKYVNETYSKIAEYYYYPYETSGNSYIGINQSSVNLKSYSQYWKIIKVYKYSGNQYEITIRPVIINRNKGECDLDFLKIGSVCKCDDTIFTNNDNIIVYKDLNNQNIGQSNIIYPNDNYYSFDPVYFGYTNDGSVKDISQTWELVDVSYGSLNYYTFIPSETTSDGDVEFILTCDKETINYQEKTICHFSAKNYTITQDPIVLELKEKDDLEIVDINPNEIFNITNNNNSITINSNYLSTTPEDLEIFTFEVKAKKQKNETNNIEIRNISFYGDETYNNLQTTIQIKSTSPLSNNPLTKRQSTIILILIVSALLLTGSKILLKKKSV